MAKETVTSVPGVTEPGHTCRTISESAMVCMPPELVNVAVACHVMSGLIIDTNWSPSPLCCSVPLSAAMEALSTSPCVVPALKRYWSYVGITFFFFFFFFDYSIICFFASWRKTTEFLNYKVVMKNGIAYSFQRNHNYLDSREFAKREMVQKQPYAGNLLRFEHRFRRWRYLNTHSEAIETSKDSCI